MANIIRAADIDADMMEMLSTVVMETWNPVAITDPLDRVLHINSGFTRAFGYHPADILGKPFGALFGPRQEAVTTEYQSHFVQGEAFSSEEIIYGKSGQRIWSSVTANPIMSRDQRHHFTVCIMTDITDTKMREVLQHRAVDAMARDVSSAEVLELICRDVEEIIPEAVVAINGLDEEMRLFHIASASLPETCRRAIRSPLGADDRHSPSWRAATTGRSVVATDLASEPVMRQRLEPFIQYGIQSCWATPVAAPDGRIMGTVTYYYFDKRTPDPFQKRLSKVLVNLCALALERRRIREEMLQLSFYDVLTGLPNRRLLLANGDNLLATYRSNSPDHQVAVMCLNINRFRHINVSLGYEAGNELLQLVAERLAGKLYQSDLVGRVGPDEFAMVLPDCDEDQAAILASRLLTAVAAPCPIGGIEFTPSASIGISMYPENGYDMEALLNAANSAMVQAKTMAEDHYYFFSKDVNVKARHSMSLESCLRAAIEHDELTLVYQPQIRFDDGTLHGVEALIRWETHQFGSVSPENFIPMAEESGLIDGISDWVIERVIRQLGDWRRRAVPVPSASINLSAPNFLDVELPNRILHGLEQHGLTAYDLVLELTEGVFLGNDPRSMETIGKAHEYGFGLSLDDFGTGFSSLGYLRRIPISEIKLDRSFVRDLGTDLTSRRLSKAILRLGENLGLRVVVEGVETEEQYYLLKSQGYHILQGFFITRPLSAPELERWLASGVTIPPVTGAPPADVAACE